MARILTRCQSEGGIVHTGRHMTQAAFDGMAGLFAVRCPACNGVHHWRKEDAWQEGQPGRNLVEAVGE